MKTSVSFHRAPGRAWPWPRVRAGRAFFAIAALSGMAGAAAAQGAAMLPETVVTATRTATRADELVSETVVIDRVQIEQQASRALPDILARLAGVQITANGGIGKPSGIFIRGAEARHAILLIDGVRYGSATFGWPNWDNIPVEMIERIEIVKGPASALYGSDGVGGVVQIFTRKAAAGDPAFRPRASVTLGSERHRQLTGGFSGAAGAATYALDVQRTTQNSFSATNDKVDFGYFNPDRDPFGQSAVNASFGYQFNRDWKFDAGLLYADGLNHFDDGPERDSRNRMRTQTAWASVSGQVMPDWRMQWRYGRGRDYTRNIVAQPGNVPGLFQTTQNQYLWQNDIATPVGIVIAGLERLEQKVHSDTRYTVGSRHIDSVFVGLNGESGPHGWQINARHDRNSQFGGHNTWFAGYGYRIAPGWRVSISHGTSFVAPSFNQLYYPDYGNPGLKPETGRNTDLGITWNRGNHTVKLTLHDNKITGFIAEGVLPQNVPRARIRGGTLGYDGQIGALGLHVGLDALDPRNEITGQRLPWRAKAQATVGIDYRTGAWTLGGSALHVGRRYDDDGNTRVMKAYTTVDLHAEYRMAKDWIVQARLTNVGNVNYQTVWGYNQPGRAFYVTLRWRPK
jgi:vitamin B12 transporter